MVSSSTQIPSGVSSVRAASLPVRSVGAIRSVNSRAIGESRLAQRVVRSWYIHTRVLREEIVRFEQQTDVLNWHARED